MHAAQKEIARSPGFEPDFDALFDLAAVKNVAILAETIRTVAESTVFAPRIRRAFVTSGPAVYGLMRMLGGYLGNRGGEIEMFQDRAAAERWLDRLPPPQGRT